MNREDITRMAQEAGFVGMDGDHGALRRFAALVAKHTLANIDPSSFMSWQEGYEVGKQTEREACANAMAYLVMTPTLTHGALVKLSDVVNAIRARGQA